ncbi:MAG: hypothetical protein IPH57_18030 [Saprospiraceae bacterium]|nr:hypothetical protein [Saprospiraceae bacterium]
MTAIELKKRIIDKIQLIENEDLLKETYRLIDIELEDIESPYVLSAEMNNAVSEARNQIKKGDFLTHNQANEQIEEWLDK